MISDVPQRNPIFCSFDRCENRVIVYESAEALYAEGDWDFVMFESLDELRVHVKESFEDGEWDADALEDIEIVMQRDPGRWVVALAEWDEGCKWREFYRCDTRSEAMDFDPEVHNPDSVYAAAVIDTREQSVFLRSFGPWLYMGHVTALHEFAAWLCAEPGKPEGAADVAGDD